MKSETKNAVPQDYYPGADINAADDNKVDEKLVKERTKTLNNNPRTTDDNM